MCLRPTWWPCPPDLPATPGDQIVDRVACLSDTPVTAARMVSLGEHGGDDDMFSNDLTDEELEAILAPAGSVSHQDHMRARCSNFTQLTFLLETCWHVIEWAH